LKVRRFSRFCSIALHWSAPWRDVKAQAHISNTYIYVTTRPDKFKKQQISIGS
jgi:hypothetical protein